MANIYKLTLGTPEDNVPSKFKKKSKIELSDRCDYPTDKIKFKTTVSGCSIELPLEDEEIFGFGLQLKSVSHRGTKKTLRSNADPLSDSGDSHAPVPFFVTNRGYGIYVDTARYASFYCGASHVQEHVLKKSDVKTSEAELYAAKKAENSVMLIDVPAAKGVDLYIIEGTGVTDIVSGYNMLSGGGCMPSLWGMGVLYRCCAKSTQEEILEFADYFRRNHIPCDIIGLEPGWQSRAYSCSFAWNKEKYPDWKGTLDKLIKDNFHVNLWEHAFVNGESPIYEEMKEHCGDFEVWEGLVPDFADEKAQEIFAEYHRKALVENGISGFKLDECDGSDFTGGWTFPNSTEFPSGLDGEQMHNLFGILYMQALEKSLGNMRTFSEVRNAGAFAAPYPFVLYSDLYNHRDFIRGTVNSGYSGILWSPEVRRATGKTDMIRRMQSVVFSTQAVLNQWYTEDAPWVIYDAAEEAREVMEIRMSLIPYLYSAFYKYHTEGKPPVRSLVFDYEGDSECYKIDDEYMFGDSMLVAPMTAEQTEREVYLPEGRWHDLWSNEAYEGGARIVVETENIPVFVKDNSVIPWAKPIEYCTDDVVFEITLKCFGEKGEISLVQDNGLTNDAEYSYEKVSFENGEIHSELNESGRYRVIASEFRE